MKENNFESRKPLDINSNLEVCVCSFRAPYEDIATRHYPRYVVQLQKTNNKNRLKTKIQLKLSRKLCRSS